MEEGRNMCGHHLKLYGIMVAVIAAEGHVLTM
jgi:hypothetical protein